MSNIVLLQIYANVQDALKDVYDFVLVEIYLGQRLLHDRVKKRHRRSPVILLVLSFIYTRIVEIMPVTAVTAIKQNISYSWFGITSQRLAQVVATHQGWPADILPRSIADDLQ